jgi:hypothetical protein
MVGTGQILSHPREVMTTGMNTCMFVVIQTTRECIGWHASLGSIGQTAIRTKLGSITKADFVSGYIIPGEDRQEGSLDLKPNCRTMQDMPWTDPTHSRRRILGFLDNFIFSESLQVLPPVQSYKDFVVFDTSHRRPYAFQDVALFDQGCVYDIKQRGVPSYSVYSVKRLVQRFLVVVVVVATREW